MTLIIVLFSLSYTVFHNSWGKENRKVIGCEFFFPLVKTNLSVTKRGKEEIAESISEYILTEKQNINLKLYHKCLQRRLESFNIIILKHLCYAQIHGYLSDFNLESSFVEVQELKSTRNTKKYESALRLLFRVTLTDLKSDHLIKAFEIHAYK